MWPCAACLNVFITETERDNHGCPGSGLQVEQTVHHACSLCDFITTNPVDFSQHLEVHGEVPKIGIGENIGDDTETDIIGAVPGQQVLDSPNQGHVTGYIQTPDGGRQVVKILLPEGVQVDADINSVLTAENCTVQEILPEFVASQEDGESKGEQVVMIPELTAAIQASGAQVNRLDSENLVFVEDDGSASTAAILEHATIIQLDNSAILEESGENDQKQQAINSDVVDPQRPHVCGYCNKGFKTLGNLKTHLPVHADVYPYSCHHCNKGFNQTSNLKRHLRKHNGERPHICGECGKQFTQLDHLKRHKTLHTGIKFYKCSLCTAQFNDSCALNRHLDVHDEAYVHVCQFCSAKFRDRRALACHIRSCNKDERNPDTEKRRNKKCFFCDHMFITSGNRRRHMRAKHGLDFKCSLCGAYFETEDLRNCHIQMQHSNDDDPQATQTTNKPFVCPECGVGFSSRRNLTVHTKIHSGVKPFQCHLCEKCFTLKYYLTVHLRTHTGERPYPCEHCGMAFTDKSTWRKHQLRHTGERPYRCETCPRTFRQLQALKDHRVTHTGEKNFPCETCGKTFARRNTLVTHQRTHSGARPHQCPLCDRAYSESRDLKKHLKTHGLELPPGQLIIVNSMDDVPANSDFASSVEVH